MKITLMTLSKDVIREITDLRYFPLTALAICLPIAFIIFGPQDLAAKILWSPLLPTPLNFGLGFIGLYGVSCIIVWFLQAIYWLIRKPFLKKPKGDFSGWDDNAEPRS